MSPTPALEGAQKFLSRGGRGVLVDGRWQEPREGGQFTTRDPATGEVLYDVGLATAPDVDAAVASARRALETGPWAEMSPDDRGRVMWAIAEALEDQREVLAVLECRDNGKPLAAARADVRDAARWFRYYAGWTTKVTGSTIPVNVPGTLTYTLRQPVGVCGLIVPWNYPLGMAAWKLAPALACGCTAILKPAEQTPLTALYLGELLLSVGVPPGVVNVVAGLGDVGAALVRHDDIDKIAFTGSTEVARDILSHASTGRMKRVSIEAGGKSPNIIFADADLDVAKEGAAFAILHNLGQDCTAGSRLFVEKPVYDEVVDYLVGRADQLVVGPGLDPGVEVGPVSSPEQLDRVLGYVNGGVEDGARLRTGGERLTDGVYAKGNFLRPVVFTDVGPDQRIVKEEIFGPVVVVQPFEGTDEVVAAANDTEFGLGAGIWTSNLARAHTLAARIRAGTVWVNTYNTVEPAVPFGGFRESGIGREHGWSGIELYTETKSVWIDHRDPLPVPSLVPEA